MDWERAKTILIITFLLLNTGLFAMNLYRDEGYKISHEDAEAISKILSGNDISLECELPPNNKPLRFLNVTTVEWDYDYISGTFFPNVTDVTRTYEEGGVIYESAQTGASVTVTNAYSSGVSRLIFAEPAASMDAEGYKKLLGRQFESFEMTRSFKNEEGDIYLYNEGLKNSVLFASSIEVVLSGGAATVSVEKFDFDSYVEGIHEIFRADEALLAFMHYKNENISGAVTIESVRLGYGVDSGGWEKTRKAKPYYRIFISETTAPIYIDAVMNTVL